MNASYEWLREFIDFDLTPSALRDMITARVATVEEVSPLRKDLGDVVVGRVIDARPHPNSDHLWVTKVDAGGAELLDVVCGAANVQAGVSYPFAPAGSTLPGGLKLERRRIRGEMSNGMLCSARELGLGTDHEGILALTTDAPAGTPFLSVYPASDTRLVIDVLPNRPDLLAHEGIAREIAAFTGSALRRPMHQGMKLPDAPMARGVSAVSSVDLSVTVDPDAACPLYTATVIRGVTIAPSPEWLARRVESVGGRSINNVVDVTNYMLHGFGQPMHAFDLARLQGSTIVVRRARAGERITTLDGIARTLDESMTVIADSASAQAIAGVIGGSGSEVTDATTDIVLEVAIFDPRSVRRTRRALGIITDASYRFERAMDVAAAEDLARYAAALIVSVAGGSVYGSPASIGSSVPALHGVPLRVPRVARVLGETIPADECARLLRSVGFVLRAGDDDVLVVTPPSWRADVTLEIDLIEEIARLRGYDSFPDELRPFRVGTARDSRAYTVGRRVTRALVDAGLLEVRPMPFVADAGADGVRVSNPLAENEALLRSSLLQTLSRRAEYNFAHMTRNIRLFETGIAFTRGDGPLPVERAFVAAVVAGDRMPPHFTQPHSPQIDIWDARWIAEVAMRAAYGVGACELVPCGDGSGWSIRRNGASIGAVRTLELDAPVWAPKVYGVELDVTDAPAEATGASTYRGLPLHPAAEFDLALLVPAPVSAAAVEAVIRGTAGELLEALFPFDEFRGDELPEGYRSVAWRLTLRHSERTLRDKEIEGRRARILRALDEELGVRPRSA